MTLIDNASTSVGRPVPWSFGGGTVLMLRMNHRYSKDVDIFIEDPQFLGFFNPRITDVAHDVTPDYVEGSGYVKLYLPEGEIDVVAAAALTAEPFETEHLLGRPVALESSAEIIAKKMWHRGNLATARDLFDLAAVATQDPGAIRSARPFLARHACAFLALLHARRAVMEVEFAAIDRRDCALTFDEASRIAEEWLRPACEG